MTFLVRNEIAYKIYKEHIITSFMIKYGYLVNILRFQDMYIILNVRINIEIITGRIVLVL